jgi:hypothetical protein
MFRRAGICPNDNHAVIAVLRVAGPQLLAVNDPITASGFPSGASSQSCEIGSSRRFGKQLTPDLLSPQRRYRKSMTLLLRRASQNDW